MAIKQMPQHHIEELREQCKRFLDVAYEQGDYWETVQCKDGTLYDVNAYSDKEFGTGETDGVNVTAYFLRENEVMGLEIDYSIEPVSILHQHIVETI